MQNNLLVDILGWVGVAALLLAYGLVSAKKVPGDAPLYQILNLAGSGLLIVNSFYYGALPSVGVNVVWIVIAALTLASKARRTVSD